MTDIATSICKLAESMSVELRTAFMAAMTGMQYGEQETNDAFYWFKAGYEAAPPAASVDVSDMPSELRWKLDNFPQVTGVFTMTNDEYQWFRKLIDSAGGVKDEYTVLRPDGTHYTTDIGGADMARKREGYRVLAESTPQPDDVAVALTHINDAANEARRAGDYQKANALVRARATLARAIATTKD